MRINFSLLPMMKVACYCYTAHNTVTGAHKVTIVLLEVLFLGWAYKLLHGVMLPLLWINYWHILMSALVVVLPKSSFLANKV